MKKVWSLIICLMLALILTVPTSASSWVRDATQVEVWDREVDF